MHRIPIYDENTQNNVKCQKYAQFQKVKVVVFSDAII